MANTLTLKPVTTAGTVLGIGMGGFVDGILFHQMLQIHNMVSARISPEELIGAKVNMFWDGAFHAVVWIVTAIGIAMLWNTIKRKDVLHSGQAFFGALLLGFGIFNLVEGVIDHHILELHHVYERAGLSIWDWVFLASGVALIATGLLMIRGAREELANASARTA